MSERAIQATLAVAGGFHLLLGLFALLDPGGFFEEVGRYLSENSHYVGDVGAFYVASGVGLLVAIRERSWRVPLLAVGAVWYGLHALNHVFDTDQARSEGRGWFDTISLALGAAGSAYLARVCAREGHERPR